MNIYKFAFTSVSSPDFQILCGTQVYLRDADEKTEAPRGCRYQGIMVKSSGLDSSSCFFLAASL